MKIRLLPRKDRWYVELRDRGFVCSVDPPRLLKHSKATVEEIDRNGQRISVVWQDDSIRVQDIALVSPLGGVSVERRVENLGNKPRSVVIDLTAQRNGSPDYTIIPGVQYQGNAWGRGKEPKGFELNGNPWRFTGTRTTIPGATVVEIDGLATGLFAGSVDMPTIAVSCSLEMASDGVKQRLIWPWGEGPCTYVDRDSYGPPWQGDLTIQPRTIVTLKAYLGISLESHSSLGWHGILRQAWNLLGTEVVPWHPPEYIRDLCRCWVRENLVTHEGNLTVFSIGLMLQENQRWIQRAKWRYEIGWCGQNASLAASMLEWGWESGNEEIWELGQKVLDSWLVVGRLNSGLILTHLDPVFENTTARGLDTCNLGTAAFQYLRAYDISKKAGRPRQQWYEVALGICDFFLEKNGKDGRFGRLWSVEGELLESEGTIGCYVIPALISAWRHARERRYLDRAIEAFWAYVNDDLANLMVTAGALDTDCIDKESAYPLLRAGLMLYEETKEKRYIDAARFVAYYLVTWMYHFDVPFADTTVLGRMGYRTTGGTTVSAQHHHIDPWGALMAPDIIRLGQLTNDEYWHQVGKAMWNQSTIGIWDDGYSCPDGIQRPSGSQDEGWCHTVWKAPGETTKWLVAWPAAFHLEGWRFMNRLHRGI